MAAESCFIIVLMVVTFLALGSNLGNRESYLKNAIVALNHNGIDVRRCASIYETEPKDVTDQPWFLNTVVEATTNLAPGPLLRSCLSIERDNRRLRTEAKTARTLDIDILFYDGQIIRESGLCIPHPRFAERKFVLVPMMELAADFVDPVSGTSIADLARILVDVSTVRRFAPPIC